MPGRHSGGPSLGGGGFRGGGGMGGGFRGGGGFSGGGDWGRGPRWGWGGGPGWGWGRFRPRFGMGGGWGWRPYMPFFGPRFGWGGGGGCGCLVIPLILVFLFICLGLGGLGSFGGQRYYRGGFNNNNNPVSNGNTGANLADESAAIQTQTARDLTELHAALDSRIPDWQSQLSNNEQKSIPPADAGLTQDNNTKEVLYGKCGTAFYLYVVENTRPDTGPADGEGYVYTTASSPGACHPPQWTVYDSEDVGSNWYFTLLKSAG
ncbi:MAG: hypothetical protein ABI947_08755 [Chloroflexota bacterium]